MQKMFVFAAVAVFSLAFVGCEKKSEAPKVEAPKVETPKVETPKVEAPATPAAPTTENK